MTIKKNNGQTQYCSDIVEEMIISQTEHRTDISLEEGYILFCSTFVDEMIEKEDAGVCSSLADDMLAR